MSRFAPFRQLRSFASDVGQQLARFEQNVAAKFSANDADAYGPFTLTQLKSSTYTARHWEIVRCAGSFTVTLPRPDDAEAGDIIVRVDSASNGPITVASPDTDVTVNGAPSVVLYGARDSLRFTPNRINRDWMVSGQPIVTTNKDRVLDTTYSPVGLWAMQNAGGADFAAGGALDTSGNGHTLTLEAGTLRYANLTTELAGCYFDGASNLVVTAFVSALAMAGDMTFLCIASDAPPTATLGALVEHGDAGSDVDPNNNTLYGIFGVASPSPGKTYLHEQGTGVNETKTTANWAMPYSANLVGFSRISNVVQFYINGRAWDTPSGTLNAPTGGSNGRLRIGGRSAAGSYYTGGICSVGLWNFGFSAAYHLERYNYCFGRSRGWKV